MLEPFSPTSPRPPLTSMYFDFGFGGVKLKIFLPAHVVVIISESPALLWIYSLNTARALYHIYFEISF